MKKLDKKNILISFLLLSFLTIISGCKKNTSSERRMPEDNFSSDSSYSIKQASLNNKNKIKAADLEYDAYQNYESIDAPVSLKDMKNARRRPVLNVQELNSMMDTNFKKPNKTMVENHKAPEEAKCTESECDLKKVIKYNKHKKKEKALTNEVSQATKANNHSAHAASTTKIASTQTSNSNTPSGKPQKPAVSPENSSKGASTSTGMHTTSEVKTTNTAKAAEPSTSSGAIATTHQGTTYSNVALPPVSLPSAKVNSQVKSTSSGNNINKTSSGEDKTKILQDIKNNNTTLAKDFLNEKETEAKPMPPVPAQIKFPDNKPIIPSDIIKPTNPSSSSYGKGGESASPSPQPTIIVTPTTGKPVAQLNKQEEENGKVKTINKILINYYHKIKTRIANIFSD